MLRSPRSNLRGRNGRHRWKHRCFPASPRQIAGEKSRRCGRGWRVWCYCEPCSLPSQASQQARTHGQPLFVLKGFLKNGRGELTPQQMLASDRDRDAAASRSGPMCDDSWLYVPPRLPARLVILGSGFGAHLVGWGSSSYPCPRMKIAWHLCCKNQTSECRKSKIGDRKNQEI